MDSNSTQPKSKKKNPLFIVLTVFGIAIVGLSIAIIVVVNVKNSRSSKIEEIEQTIKETQQPANEANDIANDIIDKLANEPDYFDNNAIADFEKAISESSGEKKIFLTTSYAFFLYNYFGELNLALETLDKLKSSISDDMLVNYYMSYRNLYLLADDNEKAKEYNDKIIQLTGEEQEQQQD